MRLVWGFSETCLVVNLGATCREKRSKSRANPPILRRFSSSSLAVMPIFLYSPLVDSLRTLERSLLSGKVCSSCRCSFVDQIVLLHKTSHCHRCRLGCLFPSVSRLSLSAVSFRWAFPNRRDVLVVVRVVSPSSLLSLCLPFFFR
jgi:hypothetical protein